MSRIDHLVEAPKAALTCPCGCVQLAARFMRCRKNRCVIARCSVSGANIERVRIAHEELCA